MLENVERRMWKHFHDLAGAGSIPKTLRPGFRQSIRRIGKQANALRGEDMIERLHYWNITNENLSGYKTEYFTAKFD